MQHLPFDISRCNNTACPLAHECLRFLDWPKDGFHRLPMNAFEYDRQAMNCEHFIQYKNRPGRAITKIMKLENQVTSIEQAKQLKELGIAQQSAWYWQYDHSKSDACVYLSLFHHGFEGQDFFKAGMGAHNGIDITDFSEEYYSAFTVAELGLANGQLLTISELQWSTNAAEAIATHLIHRLESGEVTAEEVNARLSNA